MLLDPDGRPYDVEVDPEVGPGTFRNEYLGRLHVPDGQVRVMDGNSLGVDPHFFADEATAVEFDTDDLRASLLIHDAPQPAGTTSAIVFGVRLDVSGAEVARWGGAENAYGTDGGVGAVTAQSVIDHAADGWSEKPILEGDHEVVDWDGIEGPESIVFTNGFGDGQFPMWRGFDADGRLVSLVIGDTRYPWRLAFTEGTPPPDVTEREQQLIDCMAGRRPIDHTGFCVVDED